MQPKRLLWETNSTEWDVRLELLPECISGFFSRKLSVKNGRFDRSRANDVRVDSSTRKLCRPGPL